MTRPHAPATADRLVEARPPLTRQRPRLRASVTGPLAVVMACAALRGWPPDGVRRAEASPPERIGLVAAHDESACALAPQAAGIATPTLPASTTHALGVAAVGSGTADRAGRACPGRTRR